MHILEEWRLNDIERKASEALRRCDELHETNRNVDRLERALREASSEIDGLRSRVYSLEESVERLTCILQEISATKGVPDE
jgi:predicted RNase H-like nuclease (RuvC/YqgF family)